MPHQSARRRFVYTISRPGKGAPIALEGSSQGFFIARARDERGAVLLIGDYPFEDGDAAASRLLDRGISGLEKMPDNTLCLGVRRGPDGTIAWAARDKIGNTPMYVWEDGDTIRVASSVADLRDHLASEGRSLSPSIEVPRVAEYLLFRYTSGPSTLVAGVKMPLAAHVLVWDEARASAEHRPYIDMRKTFAADGRSFDEAADMARELIASHLRREEKFPNLGVMFSGGMDSCYLAYASRRRDLTLFTLAFPGVGQADLVAAREEAKFLGMELCPVETSGAVFAKHLPTAIRSFGWPVDHPNFVARDILFARAKERGIDRLLSGDGSDTIFGGAWYVSLLKASLVKQYAPRVLRHLPPLHPRLRLIARIVDTPLDDLILFDKTYYAQTAARALSTSPDSEAPMSHLRDSIAAVKDWDALDKAFFVAYRTTLSVYPAAQRGMAWAHDADVGYPFLGEELVRLANSVPGRSKLRGFIPKRLLRKASERVLPRRVLDRKKYGLPVPFEDFILGDGGLFRYEELLRDPRSAVGDAWNRREVAAILDRLRARTHTRDDLELYWVLLNLEVWARIVLRDETVA